MPTPKTYSDYWLNELDNFNGNDDGILDLDMIHLSEARRAISNFVRILTNKSIPVYFNSKDANLTDGKVVYLSADIIHKNDFDHAVGLALHEGSHILLTDFELLITLWGKAPRDIYDIAESKNINALTVKDTIKYIWNVIEDRYIDHYVFTNAPGYRGYYIALYKKFFLCAKIDDMLKSSMYRTPSIDAYKHRICNLMNPNSDLDALPELRTIFELIDLKNIQRLKTTQDRIDVAFDVCKIIFKNLPNEDIVEDANTSNGNGNQNDVSKSITDKEKKPDAIGGIDANNPPIPAAPEPENKKAKSDEGDTSDINKNDLKQIRKALEQQDEFVLGGLDKKKVTIYQKNILDSIEKSGMTLEKVGEGFFDKTQRLDCIVVRNLTKDLIFSDKFPMTAYVFNGKVQPEIESAINQGISLGIRLGKKLMIRNELNVTKHMRKSSGKIDKRILSELGMDNERVFCNYSMDKYNDIYMHISVDASSSMSSGNKWEEALKTVTAICKACSMTDNIRVSVSFRTTINTKKDSNIPYVVFAYDSSKDKFSKVSTLFKYLIPNGMTPEGLAFEAIMKICKEQQKGCASYFLNFSDGEPFLPYKIKGIECNYHGESAARHTKTQVSKIRDRNYEILSYYISDEETDIHNENNRKHFKIMYGNSAAYIDTDNVNMVAKTINDMFLKKD
jgi:hypothetical protein